MIKHILRTGLLWIGILSTTSAQIQFSLEEAIAYALENSSTVKMQELEILDADGQILEYKSTGIPTLDASVDYQYFLDIPTQILPDFISPAVYGVLFNENLLEQREISTNATSPVRFGTDQNVTANLTMNTMIFDYTWFKGLKAQQLYRDLVRKQLEQKEFDVRSNVTKAYLAILIAEKNYELLEKNIDNLTDVRSETQAIFESGFAEQLDVDRLDFSLENLKTERENVFRLIDISKNLLKFQMGFPIRDDISLKDGFDNLVNLTITESLDLNEPVIYDNRPEYQAILMGLKLQDINQKVIKLGYLPRLDGFASYSRILQRNQLFNEEEAPWFPSTVVGISMKVSIFDGLNKKARLARAKIDEEQTLVNKREFERGMNLAVQNGRIQFINARQTVLNRQKALDLAQRIFDVAQIKYTEGVGSSLERTQAEADLYTAQNNYINALYDLIVAKTDLDIALGNL
jgi:outer membrane protein TolC